MLAAVRAKLDADPLLAARVRLLGTVEHAHIEMLMRAADLFVAGSRAEGSGYALIEALACGLPVVVTDIPAFRSLLADSDAGMLWPVGDSAALAQALMRASARPRAPWRALVRAHFEREVSFAAIGRKWSAAYRSVLPDAHD
jgi:glycosyltransferase involved in cell wall biosynthesis